MSTKLAERYKMKVLGYATPCKRNIDVVDVSAMEDKCYDKNEDNGADNDIDNDGYNDNR